MKFFLSGYASLAHSVIFTADDISCVSPLANIVSVSRGPSANTDAEPGYIHLISYVRESTADTTQLLELSAGDVAVYKSTNDSSETNKE